MKSTANNRLNYLIILCLLFPLSVASQKMDSVSYPITYKTKSFEGLIFHLDSANYGDCFESKTFIIPDKIKIDECEQLLKKNFKKIYTNYQKNNHRQLSDEEIANYTHQIAAYIDKNGNEILFISGVNSSLNKTKISYRTSFICSAFQLSAYCLECPNYTKIDWWGIKYNCKTKEFFDFTVFDPS